MLENIDKLNECYRRRRIVCCTSSSSSSFSLSFGTVCCRKSRCLGGWFLNVSYFRVLISCSAKKTGEI